MARLILSRRARHDLIALPRQDAVHLLARAIAVAAGLDTSARMEPIKASDRRYRVRFGVWRALMVRDDEDWIVHRIGHRREIYR